MDPAVASVTVDLAAAPTQRSIRHPITRKPASVHLTASHLSRRLCRVRPRHHRHRFRRPPHANTHTDPGTDSDSDSGSDANASADSNTHAYTDTNASADTNANASADTNANADTNTNTNTNTNTGSDTYANADTHTHTDSDSDSDTHTDSRTEPDANANTCPNANADSDANANADSDANAIPHISADAAASAAPEARSSSSSATSWLWIWRWAFSVDWAVYGPRESSSPIGSEMDINQSSLGKMDQASVPLLRWEEAQAGEGSGQFIANFGMSVSAASGGRVAHRSRAHVAEGCLFAFWPRLRPRNR